VISLLRGELVERAIDSVVIDVGGVGYRVTVSLHTLAALPQAGGQARLLTYLQVREDALTLFGFATERERTAFELCISVQQVGPKLAMSILSTLTPEELADAVRREDVARLRKISGVGQKTAERLVLELRDKVDKAGLGTAPRAAAPVPDATARGADEAVVAQVVSALTNLGYRPAESKDAAERAAAATGAAQASVAELVKRALRLLAE
jgi:Holliday junction DNA helicase RuvA